MAFALRSTFFRVKGLFTPQDRSGEGSQHDLLSRHSLFRVPLTNASDAEFESAEALHEHLHGEPTTDSSATKSTSKQLYCVFTSACSFIFASIHSLLRFAGTLEWHLEMSSSETSLSLANATIQRCDDILNAQFGSLETDLALTVPFSDELHGADFDLVEGSNTHIKSVQPAASTASGANKSGSTTKHAAPLYPSSVSSAAYASAVPVSTVAAQAGVSAAPHPAPTQPLKSIHDNEEDEYFSAGDEAEAHEGRVCGPPPAARGAPTSAAPATESRFVLHAPAAWYDDVGTLTEDAVAVSANAHNKEDDGFIPVVPKRRGARSGAAGPKGDSSPHSARSQARKHRARKTKSTAQTEPKAPVLARGADVATEQSLAMQTRVREQLILSPGADGTAKKLTAFVHKVIDAHTVMVKFTGDYQWVTAPGIVSLPDTSRVVQGAHVHVTATDVKQRPASMATDVPSPWFLQCSAVPVKQVQPMQASLPQSAGAAQTAAADVVPPTAAAAPVAAPTAVSANALPSTAESQASKNAAAAPASGAPASDKKKKRVFNVNAAEFVPGMVAPQPMAPLLMSGARMMPFGPPAAVAVAHFHHHPYTQHLPGSVPVTSTMQHTQPQQQQQPQRHEVATTAQQQQPAAPRTAITSTTQPVVRILQRPDSKL